jgi:putative NIF3 family GTP cyclohydrolase 1 type 2
MKHRDVIEQILNYHPTIPNYSGCDDYKFGDPDATCTGVVTAMTPTIDVIRKTAALGCNLLLVHEPTFYTTPDFPDWRGGFANAIYDEKCRLLEQYGITIWRDHDHMHVHEPDSIFSGVIEQLGWSNYLTEAKPHDAIYKFQLPKMTVKQIEQHLIETLNLNGVRLIGNPSDTIEQVAIVGHLFPEAHGGSYERPDGSYHEYATTIIREMEAGVDLILPGEVVEWTVLSYIRDANQLGYPKAMMQIGHFSLEELGMKDLAHQLRTVLPHNLPIHYINSGDMFNYTKR